ncbi:MAG: VWA domain-containing protein [Terriglobales bacterium]
MKIPMKHLFLTLALVLVTTAGVAQQPSTNDLPSAPSATLEKPKPKPPPQAPAPQQAPQPATTQQSEPAPPQAMPAPPQNQTQPSDQQAKAAPANTGNADAAPPDDERNPITTIKKTVDEVNIIFTVTDKHGRFVKDLTKNDFKVIDDNKPAVKILSFSSETNLPLRVGLLVDASNSIRDRFRFEQESAIEFLNQIIRPKSDRAFVIGFDTTAEITQDFTDNSELLSKGVRMLRPGGGTALYDALYFACRDKLMKAGGDTAVRKAIILISDGNDNQSRVTREEAIEMAQKAEVIVYTISTNVSGVKERGDRVLERISDATGGRAFFPFKIQDVSDAFSAIQDELRSQYALAYKPADFRSDGRFRSIDILADKKNMHIRARKGYFAPNQ